MIACARVRDWRDRMVDRLPRVLLHTEGFAVAVAAIALYFYADYPWWLLVALALAPDLSMVGYLATPRPQFNSA
jgi:predicted MFS family arabinose efflux permease